VRKTPIVKSDIEMMTNAAARMIRRFGFTVTRSAPGPARAPGRAAAARAPCRPPA
jgi:hypothetical protein